jgi:hypothetical protein
MRRAAVVLVIVGLASVPLGAQGRGRRSASQGIPPGHMPPPGQCRVWYEGRPPGHQPAPVNCREAERIAARDRYARVIYGSNTSANTSANQGRPRAIPRQDQPTFPGRYPTSRRGDNVYTRVAFDNGYIDGREKGEEDARKNRSYDVDRHSRYRSADRGYDERYGSRDQYRTVYRDGFQAGYDESFRDLNASGRTQNRFPLPWPF